MSGDATYDTGMKVRREVLGDEHVYDAIANAIKLTAPSPEFVTRYAWGGVWPRDGLDRMRSAMTLAVLTSPGREDEFQLHVRAAVPNGLTTNEISEVLFTQPAARRVLAQDADRD
jgi:4-carboxymuconolactone decarboxylase